MKAECRWGGTAAAAALCVLICCLAPPASAQIALLDSARTRAYFGAHYAYCDLSTGDPNAIGADTYKQYFQGWQVVLEQMRQASPGDASLAYSIVDDDFIVTGLARSSYRVLILSNNIALSSAQTDAIRNWVAAGGRLLATFGSGYEPGESNQDSGKPLKNTLQQLWGDPASKVVSSGSLGMVPPVPGAYPPGSVEPLITRLEGPTASICRFYDPVNNTCPPYLGPYQLLTGYGDLANMLVQRPENNPGVYGYFAFANNLLIYDPGNIWPDTQYDKPLPAVIASPHRRGWAVYYAFAPEFIVGLEYDVAGHCGTDPNYPGEDPAPGLQSSLTWENNHWAGRTPELRSLMKSTVDFLLKIR